VLSVLIPAYNEAASIAAVVKKVRETMDASGLHYEMIVIDDGSSDDTAKRAEADGVQVIRHPRNAGYGRALKTGIRHARFEWCGIVDADGSYPVERLPDLFAFTPAYDMVVGARTGPNYWGSSGRHMARAILLRLVRFVAGTKIPDVNSGFRIFRKDIALAHSSRISSGFSFTTTLTLAMILDEHFVHYLPIDYHPRVGKTKVRMRRDVLRMLQILVQTTLFYNPLKAFLAACLASVLAGLALGAGLFFLDRIVGLAFFGAGLLVAILVGAVGLLAETVRMHRAEARLPRT
jgi:glycosyltransferase involved in cell wall biosynthesis